MIRDASELDPTDPLDAHVVVVGAGAAGLTLATAMQGRGVRVVVLESGGLDPSRESRKLNVGVTTGQVGRRYLTEGRVRALGGSTRHWGGGLLPLLPIDFQARDWVQHDEGWPFGPDVLIPYYRRALALLGGPAFFDGAEASRQPVPGVEALETIRISTAQHVDLLGEVRAGLASDPDITVLLHATAVAYEVQGDAVRAVQFRRPDGEQLSVRASTVVLAAGGIENPRLLLASDAVLRSVHPDARDLIGRYLSGHFGLTGWCRMALLQPGGNALRAAMKGPEDEYSWRVLTLSEAHQREARTLAVAVSHAEGDTPAQRLEATFPPDPAADDIVGARTRWAGGDGAEVFALHAMSEVPPHPENRVTLDRDRDASGLPRLKVHVATSDETAAALTASFRELARVLGLHDMGRMRIPGPLTPEILGAPDTHYIGATRMHDDPRRGVVDAELTVHGLANLHVVSSSVFPSAGWSQTTLTIVALAYRLADRILGDR